MTLLFLYLWWLPIFLGFRNRRVAHSNSLFEVENDIPFLYYYYLNIIEHLWLCITIFLGFAFSGRNLNVFDLNFVLNYMEEVENKKFYGNLQCKSIINYSWIIVNRPIFVEYLPKKSFLYIKVYSLIPHI